MLFVTGIFILGAIIHPQEFSNIFHGIIYYLAIPTMYLLLIIYSICNLHVVSWGTREVVQTKAAKEKQQEKEMQAAAKKAKEEAKTNPLGFLKGLTKAGKKDEDGWTLSCGGCCRCLCCPHPGQSPTDTKITMLAKQNELQYKELKALITHGEKGRQEESSGKGDLPATLRFYGQMYKLNIHKTLKLRQVYRTAVNSV